MCGRFNVTSDPLSQFLMAVLGVRHQGQDNFNLAPTEMVEVLRLSAEGTPELVPMRWWLTPFWAKELTTKYAMFNAKSETAHKSPAFKEAYLKRRCVVPISGFYEWSKTDRGTKEPYFILPQEHEGMLLAGLWDSWRVPAGAAGAAGREAGEVLLSFTILTTAAHTGLEFLHHRQPVMLSVEEARRWLDAEIATDQLRDLMAPRLPVTLSVVPVSKHVNNARNKDDRCMHPVAEATTVPNSIL